MKAIFKIRIILFGPPNEILCDNRGEFNNYLLRDLLNQLNVFIRTTPGESPWSNGITENAILWNMINKLLIDKSNNYSVDITVAMGCYGFSPNQLVFNKSSNFISVLIDKSPALEGKTSSEIIVNHWKAIYAAHKAFIEAKVRHWRGIEKLRRGINTKTRAFTGIISQPGDIVWYKQNDKNQWTDQETVLGWENKQTMVNTVDG